MKGDRVTRPCGSRTIRLIGANVGLLGHRGEFGEGERAIDYAKLGRLFLTGGVWNGEQVVSGEWIRESTSLDPLTHHPDYYPDHWGQIVYADGGGYYKYMWYGALRDTGEYDFYAVGDHGQYLTASTCTYPQPPTWSSCVTASNSAFRARIGPTRSTNSQAGPYLSTTDPDIRYCVIEVEPSRIETLKRMGGRNMQGVRK